MAQTVPPSSITVTAAYEPRAGASRARRRSGELRKEARQWRDGLAWSAKLQLLSSGAPLKAPYEVTVHGYFPPEAPHGLPSPHDWFESIATALGDALGVDPAEISIKPGRVGYTPPFAPAHFEIVISSSDVTVPLQLRITCPACSTQWTLDPATGDGEGDRCPHCGHEGAGLPFLLGML